MDYSEDKALMALYMAMSKQQVGCGCWWGGGKGLGKGWESKAASGGLGSVGEGKGLGKRSPALYVHISGNSTLPM